MTDTQDLRPLIRAALEAGDKSGGVMTRDGRDVVIYTADGLGPYPIHGFVLESVDEVPAAWSFDGRRSYHSAPSRCDLIPRPAPKRRVRGWVNVYVRDGIPDGYLYESKDCADKIASDDRIACIEIDVEEGQGL